MKAGEQWQTPGPPPPMRKKSHRDCPREEEEEEEEEEDSLGWRGGWAARYVSSVIRQCSSIRVDDDVGSAGFDSNTPRSRRISIDHVHEYVYRGFQDPKLVAQDL